MKKKTIRKKVQNNPPKAILGALLSTGVSIGTSLIGANAEKKQAERDARAKFAQNQATTLEADKLALNEFEEEGLGNVEYYQAKGGKLAGTAYKTKGGDLKDLSSDAQEVVGNKHNETAIDNTSGVKLNNGKQDIAEVEDGEVIKDDRMVFSDQSTVDGKKTYAEVARKLADSKGKLEEDLINKDKISMATNRRKIKAIDKTENDLFIKQEAEKGNNVREDLPKGAEGMDLAFADTKVGKGLTSAVPYIDNVANALITANTPRIPKPTLVKPRALETDVNVNPQLASIRDAVDSSTKYIQHNTSSSATARNAIASTKLAGAKQTGQVLASKENQERDLRNANTQNLSRIDAINTDKLDATALQQVGRRDAVQQRTSANFANIADDFTEARNFKATEAYNKERLEVVGKIGNVEGTTFRTNLSLESEKLKIKTDPAYAEEMKRKAKGDTAALSMIEEILNNI